MKGWTICSGRRSMTILEAKSVLQISCAAEHLNYPVSRRSGLWQGLKSCTRREVDGILQLEPSCSWSHLKHLMRRAYEVT